MHEPRQEPAAGGEPPDRHGETTPDWEVMTGPGGPEPAGEPAWDRVWRRRSGRARAVIAASTVAVLALGGTVAYAATSGSSSTGATPSASGSASPAPSGPGQRHGGGRWFDFGGMGVHGEATVRDRDTGKWVVRVWQRGTVEKIDGDHVTVKSEDGARWTWTVGSDSTVLHDGTKGSGTGGLKKGETALLVGTRADNGTRTARRVLAGDLTGKGPGGDWRGKFPGRGPGHGPRDWRMPAPWASPSGSGATT